MGRLGRGCRFGKSKCLPHDNTGCIMKGLAGIDKMLSRKY